MTSSSTVLSRSHYCYYSGRNPCPFSFRPTPCGSFLQKWLFSSRLLCSLIIVVKRASTIPYNSPCSTAFFAGRTDSPRERSCGSRQSGPAEIHGNRGARHY